VFLRVAGFARSYDRLSMATGGSYYDCILLVRDAECESFVPVTVG
jgi:hypothetical protein